MPRILALLFVLSALALAPLAGAATQGGVRGVGVLEPGCPIDALAADVFCPPYPISFSLQGSTTGIEVTPGLEVRHYADMAYEQIAEVLEIERGTVAATLHAAHATLREQISEVRR